MTDIAPHDFDTPIFDMSDDGVPLSFNDNQIHPLTYLLASCSSSRILYDLYGTLRPDQDPSYESVLAADKKLGDLPGRFASLESSMVCPLIERSVKCLTDMMLSYRYYLIHRPYFLKSLRDADFARTREACISSACSILSISEQGIPDPFYRLWNVTIWLVAAGLVLALDLLQKADDHDRSVEVSERRAKLDNLATLLSTRCDRSGIGARGAAMIRKLRFMETNISEGHHQSLEGLSREDILRIISPDAGAVQRDSVAQARQATRDGNHENLWTQDTEQSQAVEEPVNLESYWTMDGTVDTGQMFFDPLATTSAEIDHYINFFADLGQ